MNNKRRDILRIIDAVSVRPSKESAKVVGKFFYDCLQLMHYPNTGRVGQELGSKPFVDLIDHLLLMHAVEKGFFRLETDDVQITLRVSYNPMEEEELGLPSLALLGEPTTTSSITFVIGRSPDAVIDERMLSVLKTINQRNVLQVRVEPLVEVNTPLIPVREPTLEQETELQETELQEPVQQVSKVIELLGLSMSFLKKNLQELTESSRLWRTEDALVALTIVVKNVRIIVGMVDPNKPIDVAKIKFLLDRIEGNEYILGVLLVPPATKKKRWQEDNQGKGYRDILVGSVPQEKLDEAEHELLV